MRIPAHPHTSTRARTHGPIPRSAFVDLEHVFGAFAIQTWVAFVGTVLHTHLVVHQHENVKNYFREE